VEQLHLLGQIGAASGPAMVVVEYDEDVLRSLGDRDDFA
jgi:hypothetical protein